MTPIDGMTTKPYGCEDTPSFFAPVWYSCLLWAANQPEVVAEFEKDTGHSLSQIIKARGIDTLIDDASGRTRATVVAFADWVTLNYWGEDDGKEPPL